MIPTRGFARPLRPLRALSALVAILALAASPTQARAPEGPRPPVAESASGNYLAALAAGAKRDTGAAALYLREALRDSPRNVDLLERAFVAELADGQVEAGARLAERLVARQPGNPLAHVALAVRDIRGRRYGRARASLAKAGGRSRAPDLTASLLVAWTRAGSGDLKQALATVDRFREPGVAIYADFHGGLMADALGDHAEAGRRLGNAFRAEGSTARVADAYARHQARHGDRAEAIRAYELVDRASPGQPLVLASLRQLREGGVPEPLVATVPQGAAEVLYGLGALGGRAGDDLAALVYLRLALHLNPLNEVAQITLAETLEGTGQADEAIAAYRALPDASPYKARARVREAVVMDTAGRADEAIDSLKGAMTAQPPDLDALNALATLHRSKKRWDEAIAVSSRAIEVLGAVGPRDWAVLYGRGIALERAKRWPEAERDLEATLALLPDPPRDPLAARNRAQVLNYLAYSRVDRNTRIEESFAMLKRAVELQPRDGHIVDSLGWAHYRLGRFDDATRELERAVELRPADSVINDHLGDAYWRVGRRLEAQFQWAHARDLNPEPEDLPGIQRKLERGLDEPPLSAEAAAAPTALAPAPGALAPPASSASPVPVPDAPAPHDEPGPLPADLLPPGGGG